ncbi:hypothetical protein H681_00025 [Pseudomonas sp. ATCC 13867]|uniref:hypothetical protein n=1 Tax=Pseudomonas sp. ATCC 13867 TaxID=1294143 RepID=UPI0002C4E80B|nr:hypothetical protein [Pseudomonas sp. ATCC 13867]AGI21887.1 hypothetical protein H681_00025 [Pseudomonas sp. ATCC 13867]RFQ20253.1 hypothetical protein D0N87_24675 [Pseudomonas sp. ATCC 13867]
MADSLKTLFNWFPALRTLFQAKTEHEFDDFLDRHFEECIQRMEAEAHHLTADKEEKLSAFLAAALSMPGLSVVREGYSNGRVDLTIKSESIQSSERRLAEAKIYAGSAKHVQAIQQLVSRYSTGRQSRGYVVEYIQKPGISDIVVKLRAKADIGFPVNQQGTTCDHRMKWAYISDHRHTSQELIRVVHINVNLHR